ncbi:unnamed protein product [Lymnaea stagnalis]|uniref:TIR domain-containing protein n=1 Tax=Lymnaea stagnalis TaxID=6523 RepID=A0AAV2H3W6_LYMST
MEKGHIGSENERGDERVEDDGELQKQTDVKDDDVLDVLIVYDAENEETNEDLTEKVTKLQRTISCDFGLDVNNIDARRLPGRLKLDHQTEEISRARTVLVLLSEDSPSSIFTSVLAYIPSIITDCKENGRAGPKVLMGLAHGAVEIPRMLKKKEFHKIDMSTILDRIQISPEEEEEDVEERMESMVSQTDVKLGNYRDNTNGSEERASVKDYHSHPSGARDGPMSQSSVGDFSDCVGAKMSLFCALINKEWTSFVKSP